MAYDSTLKRLLLELVDRPEPGPYRAYLDVLAQWLDLVGEFGLSPREERAVAGFGAWIAGWREAAVPGDFVLEEEQTWDRLLDLAAEGVTVDDEEGQSTRVPTRLRRRGAVRNAGDVAARHRHRHAVH